MKTYKGGRGILMAFFRGRPLRPFWASPPTDIVVSISAPAAELPILGLFPDISGDALKCPGLKGSKGGGEL